MAFKLNKTDTAALERIVADCNKSHEAYTDALAAYEAACSAAQVSYAAALADAFADLQPAVDALSDSVEAARDFVGERAGDWRADFDEHSDRWQESDAGREAEELISAWENWNPDLEPPAEPEVEDLEPISPPENPGDSLFDLLEGVRPSAG